jgi:Flp pilus assembly protein TadB
MRYSLRLEENETLSSEADLKTVFISVILAIVICFFINGFLLTATIVLILFIFIITIIFLMRHFIKKYDENLVLGFAEVTNIVVILTIVSSEA